MTYFVVVVPDKNEHKGPNKSYGPFGNRDEAMKIKFGVEAGLGLRKKKHQIWVLECSKINI